MIILDELYCEENVIVGTICRKGVIPNNGGESGVLWQVCVVPKKWPFLSLR